MTVIDSGSAAATAAVAPADPFAFTILSGRDAPSTARYAIDLRTRDWVSARTAEDLALALNEVVINAVRHGVASGAAPIQIEGAVHEDCLCVEVTNVGPRFEHAPGGAAPSENDGRGLAMVGSMARRWGARHEDGYTTVWFELGLA